MTDESKEPELFGFGKALEHLKAGRKVARSLWVTYLVLIPVTPAPGAVVPACVSRVVPWIGLVVDCEIEPWVPSTVELLAEDWVIEK